ncbi:nucleoside deaminase [Mycobacterium talmoniae]|uniref:tRNA-specific adenosine deaminase n=1 Tax=Mycobacterium talmoniae TaxID=1858794 RepID=A0A1S1NHD2_9MYCO|nr:MULTISPECIES: nucleoside deaminase [Mycobacterium]OHV02518.1 hypothetical protein BKN37_15845 [Mycobacterium talmoniae]PQM45913.1 tRNA-specific adenosine deaminase [Mycobacterium talmoniae]
MSDIAARVQDYLDRTRHTFPPGCDRYFARIALEVALRAYHGGNFGIGAVAVVRSGRRADLFYGENAMAQPGAVIEHAETQAVLKVAAGDAPDHTITPPEPSPAAVTVYGTVEPCPMCACVLTNAGVQRSVSTCLDGELERDGDFLTSGGGANVLGDKYPTQPRVWRDIQRARGLRFELLAPDEPELWELSWKILAETRDEIDELLATRPGIGQRRAAGRD